MTATKGFQAMSVDVLVESESDVERIIDWVAQFEQINAYGSWDDGKKFGRVTFCAESVEQYQRLVDYVASWDGEHGQRHDRLASPAMTKR
ncbi:hypothetical protein CRM89_00285 [Nocardia sp. FDAARGOS_372]|uniref:hypothetical protein n=1 Tax=Nocardia sp. FDAARGOS_372 TaxID=2018066 RepID=UPI000BF0B040|nr:hypothetical protein [Nocardia sp. FDAARGOS_372]PEH74624.1 hypothetical protein CRM89_00285 [Nocardia sp. FDAARGOS_372]